MPKKLSGFRKSNNLATESAIEEKASPYAPPCVREEDLIEEAKEGIKYLAEPIHAGDNHLSIISRGSRAAGLDPKEGRSLYYGLLKSPKARQLDQIRIAVRHKLKTEAERFEQRAAYLRRVRAEMEDA